MDTPKQEAPIVFSHFREENYGILLFRFFRQFLTKQAGQVISPAIENPVYHDFLIVNMIKRHIAPADQIAIGNRTAGNQNRRSGFRKLFQGVQLGGNPIQSLFGCTGIGEDCGDVALSFPASLPLRLLTTSP